MEPSRPFPSVPDINSIPRGIKIHAGPPQNFVPPPLGLVALPADINPPMNSGPPLKESIRSQKSRVDCLKFANFFGDLEKCFGCSIKTSGPNIMIETHNLNIQDIKGIIEQKLNSLPFDQPGEWFFLNNIGQFQKFEDEIGNLLESKYKEYYLVLSSDSYVEHSLNVCFMRLNNNYACYFAKIGGVHFQQKVLNRGSLQIDIEAILKQEDVENYDFDHLTIRPIKRNNEDATYAPRNYVWEWLHESKQYRPYEEEAIYLIEYSYKNYKRDPATHNLVIIQGSNGISYQIYFKSMIQFNEKTRFKRPIRRVPEN